MRLHSLEITAFGPFPEPVTVDFDALSQASVFLLCGDTGAGKSTVLDAVCFAFYGDVPNDRSRAKQLRSHHATPGAVPRVVLESTVAGRRLRFTRSPAWQRAKKRGAGTTTEQARVLVEELVEGTWCSRTNRLDEAGHLVSGLLGMTLGQFSQVVLLPQGQFDTFLRSSSEERHTVLTQLFRTSRFEDVERWLAERRTTLRRDGETHREAVTGLLHRISEATARELPDWAEDVVGAADDGSIEAWTATLALATGAAVEQARTDRAHAAGRLRDTAELLEEGRRLAGLRARHTRALATHDRLLLTADDSRRDLRELDRARRSAVVAPLLRIADDATAAASSRAAAARIAVSSVSDLLTEPADEETLAAGARDASARAAVARSFLPRARALARTEARIGELDTTLVTLTARRADLVGRIGTTAARLDTLEASVTGLRVAAAKLPQARHQVSELGRLLSQLAVLDELAFQVADFSQKRDQQRLQTIGLRERLADVREQRLHSMASELADAMAVGADCPVCGSVDHPAPARPSPGAPSRDDERALRDQVDTAEVLLETHRDQVRGYQARLDALRDELGTRSSEQTVAELEVARNALQTAITAEKELARTETELSSARAAERADVATLAGLDADLRVTTEQRTSALQSVADVSRELTGLLGGAGDANDLMALVQRSERAVALLSRARKALADQTESHDRAARALEAARTTAAQQGFTDLGDARDAERTTAHVAELEGRVDTRLREETEVSTTLSDPEIRAALESPLPDLDALLLSQDEATEAHTAAAGSARAAELRHTQVGDLSAALDGALRTWRPLREEYAAVRSLAELAEGKGTENTRQMRLSAYVLAARLAQVVAAANERLGRMTDDRYALEHTSVRGVGERRGGLSLLVRDQWTDDLRDPVTLSGGETFVVSLALALGLADVVTGEAGGARIETLFVDEGFGSLDSDTLELVMDTLDQLRRGGRVVGVVSHVPELRTRIPTQLVVHKTRTGSSLDQGQTIG